MSISAPRVRLMERPLDAVSDADITLALSTRSLKSSYKGPCVQVRRDPPENALVFLSKVDGYQGDRIDDVTVSATGDVYVAGRQRAATFYNADGSSTIVGADYGILAPCIAKYAANGTPVWLAGINGYIPAIKGQIDASLDGNIFTFASILKRTSTLSMYNGSGTLVSLPWSTSPLYAAPLLKYSGDGNIVWCGSVRSPGYDVYARCVAPDQASGVYVGGGCFSSDPATVSTLTFYDSTGAAAATLDAAGNRGVGWLGRYNASGNLLWTSSIKSGGIREFTSLVPDRAGGVFATGGFTNYANVMHSNGATFATLTGSGAFISQYDAAGTALAAFRAADSSVLKFFIASDGTSNGNIYLSGTSSSGNIYHSNNSLAGQIVAPTGSAAFLVKYNSDLKAVWWTSVDGAQTESSTSLTADSNGVYLSGTYATTAGGTANIYHANTAVAGVLPFTSNGGGFLVNYSPTGNVMSWNSTSSGSIEGIALDPVRNRAMVVGYSASGTTANILNQSGTVLSSITGTGEAGFLGGFQLGSTTQDIGFKGRSLDTDALRAHCPVSSNGYIQTWYSQSPALTEPIVREYPPAALSVSYIIDGNYSVSPATTVLSGCTHGNGTYIIKASSVYGNIGQNINGSPGDAFDRQSTATSTNTSYWESGPLYSSTGVALYTTTTVDGVGVPGEWLEIKLPYAVSLGQYGIMPRSEFLTRTPMDFTIAGSQDGAVWVTVDSRTSQSGYLAGTLKQFTLTTPSTPYQYFRLIVSRLVATSVINIGEWRLYASSPITDLNATQSIEMNQPLLIENGIVKTTPSGRPLIDFTGSKSLVVGYDSSAAGTPTYSAGTSGLTQSTYATTISTGEVIGTRTATPTLTENQQFAYGSTPNTLSSARLRIGSVPIMDTLSQNAQTSCLAAFSFRKLNGNYKGPVVRLRKTFEYPPLPLTSNTQVISGQPYGNGTYVASASAGTNVQRAFDRDPSLIYISAALYNSADGYYIGSATTTVGGVVILGEWVQLALPTTISVAMYAFQSSSATAPDRHRPRDWTVAGSNDGETWDLVDARVDELYSGLALGEYKQFQTNYLNQSYNTFRLIVTRCRIGNSYVHWSDIRLYPTLDEERDFYGSSSAIEVWIGSARGKIVQLFDQSSNGKHATQSIENFQPYAEKQYGVYVAHFNGTVGVPQFMTFGDIYPASFWAQYYINTLNSGYATLFARAGADYGFRLLTMTSDTNDFLGSNIDIKPYWVIQGQYGSNNQNPKSVSLQVWNRVTGSRMTSDGPINQIGRGYTPLFRDFNGFLAELVFWSKPALVSDALVLDASPLVKTTSTYLSQTLNTTIGRLGALVSRGFATLMNAVQIMSSFASTSSGPRTGSGSLILNNQNFGNFQYMVKRGTTSIQTGYIPTDYFSSVQDTAAAFVVIDGNLTIGAGCTFTPPVRKLFTVIYVTGNLVLDGEISKTARGANHNATGTSGFLSVFPAKDIMVYNGEYGDLFGATNAYVPAGGASGGVGSDTSVGGTTGAFGKYGYGGNTGGGGSGGNASGTTFKGNGGAGTSFSGGTGGGGAAQSGTATTVPLPGEPNGGRGGAGAYIDAYNSEYDGAGNGPNGTGGTLIVICNGTVSGSGSITSHGSLANVNSNAAGGGGSGGGSAWLLAGSGGDAVKVTARGGLRGGDRSGLGGNGSAMKISLRNPSISASTRSSVIGAYSLRRLFGGWGGPVVRVRHGTTNEQRDFYSEDLPVGAALDTFVSGNVAYIQTWYDQSGSNNHASQTVTTSQPWIVRDASWTSKPTVRCGGTGFLTYSGTGLVNTNYTVAISTARTSNGINNYFLGGTASTTNQNLTLGYRTDILFTHIQYNADYNMTVAGYVAPIPETFVVKHSSTLGKTTHRNGSLLGSSVNVQPLTAYAGSAIGRFGSAVYNGDISEVILLSSYVSDTERSILETSMILQHLAT